MIPYGRQEVTRADIDAVVAVLQSDFLTQGPAVPQFEQCVARACAAAHAVAVCNATAALHLACLALGLGPGDVLWTSPISFVASANCALYCGATVDFVDVDPATGNLSVSELEAKLVTAQRDGRLPKIVVPVHLCGQPCDMAAIQALGQRYGFRIIEDASHAVGARYRGEPVGCGRYSDITVFSFHPVKIITTGEGGMALTRDRSLAETMQLLRSHGITRDPQRLTQVDGPWFYQQQELGFNYRLTDLQAALGTSQMARLNRYVMRRAQIAAEYDEQLRGLPVQPLRQHPDAQSSWHLYVVQVDAQLHAALFDHLRAQGIGVNLHYIPIHTQPYYERLGFRRGDFPHAERYYSQAISLPMFPTLSSTDQALVVQTMRDGLRRLGA